MKTRTQAFKDNIKEYGRQLDSIVTYYLSGQALTLGNEDLNSISPHFEGSILKSVMKVLELDSNVDIPLGTPLNFQFGIKVRNDETQNYRNNYDYVDYGNYIVYKSEKQEDTNSYLITCYDKMLYSMKDYESLNITYPITIRNYINKIAEYMGIPFENIHNTFANYSKEIPNELYLDAQGNSLGYTFRDVLDQLAEVTGSTICINSDDALEVRYINDTADTIDENYLKNINVKFGEQYGPINTVVLSRAESDKIYLSYPADLPEDERIAVEINDNQIMNRNDRDTYMSDILNKLLGLQYYLNDFSSTGICYYDLCDRYNITIGDNTYSCVMFNDDVQITTGLQEDIYTDMPKESVTDYTKADTTDRRINQTYLIVDKQNQTIESVISNVNDQDEKISQITQTVDEINSKISDVADITTSNETINAVMTMDDINASEPVQLKIYPIGSSITYLYPRSNLYPSSTLYSTTRYIRFHNNTDNTNVDYILPEDLLYYDTDNYDEFLLDYGDGTSATQICQVTKKCKYNADGTVGLLLSSETHSYTYPSIPLTDGDYTISLVNYNQGYIYARLMAKNIYTTQFYTKAETNSIISQTTTDITLGVSQTLSNYSTKDETTAEINIKANEINQTVSQKVGKNEVISSINQTPESITINANKLDLTGYVTVNDLSGSGTTTINGSNITTGTIDASQVNVTNLNASNITSGTISGDKINGGTISGTTINVGTDLRVGNNIYVGQNQSSISNVNKIMYLTRDAYLKRLKENDVNTLQIKSNGSVALWADNYYFAISGAGGIVTNATSTPWSDERLKENIKDIDVEWIKDLKVKEFKYKKNNPKKQIGLIAQDYEYKDYNEYFLNKVISPEDGKEYYTINYQNITNALIKYCQELEQRIEKLERNDK